MKLILLLASSLFLCGCQAQSGAQPHDSLSYIKFRNIIAIVESNNNPTKVGDNGLAIGIYQIHQICFKDAQRFNTNLLSYKYTYCFDPVRADDVFLAYIGHYCAPQVNRINNGKGTWKDYEIIARIWNGGPLGLHKNATIKYWNRVKLLMIKANLTNKIVVIELP